MHFSDSSKSSDSSGSREARASMGRLLSYWRYYRRKIHLLSRALFMCDHRGFTFVCHCIITIIITSSSHYHHIIITSSPSSSHHYPQLVKITSNITSAEHQLERLSNHGKKRKRVFDCESKSIYNILYSYIIVRLRGSVGHCVHGVQAEALCTLSAVYTVYTMCTFILVIWVWKCKDHWTTKDCRLSKD